MYLKRNPKFIFFDLDNISKLIDLLNRARKQN